MTIDIAVTGVSGAIGARLLAHLEADAHVGRIVGFDQKEPDHRSRKLEFHCVDLGTVDLKPLLDGVDVIVHLAGVASPILDVELMARINVEGTRRVLDAAAAVGVSRVVRLSSASVYGAWPNNPVPLTEDAPLRPNGGFAPAAQAAEIERMLAEWRHDHPSTTVVVLRAAPVIGADNFVMRILQSRPTLRVRGVSPAVQVVHADDVASALALAVTDLDGVYNLGADGWLSSEEAAALVPRGVLPALPTEVLERLLGATWRSGIGEIPPSVLPYVTNSWVVANDRLRAAGWTPTYTNAEALVVGVDDAHATPERYAVLAGAAVTVLAVGAVTWAVLRHLRRS